MKFALALMIATHFWAARNVEIPCHPVAVLNADAQLPQDPGVGVPYPVPMATVGCRILISHYATPGDGSVYCAEVVHEVGHVAGLPHVPTGIMAPTFNDSNTPYDCTHWRKFRRSLHTPQDPSPP